MFDQFGHEWDPRLEELAVDLIEGGEVPPCKQSHNTALSGAEE